MATMGNPERFPDKMEAWVMIKSQKIGKQTEYTETVHCACGCVVPIVTLGYKMQRAQVRIKRDNPCLRCQMKDIMIQSAAHEAAKED